MQTSSKFLTAAQKAWAYILDTVAPPDPLVRKAELIGSDGFAALAERAEKSGSTAFFPYGNEVVRASLVEIKTYLNRRLVSVIAGAMHQAIVSDKLLEESGRDGPLPLLVPIPMTKKSLRERGWNQCRLLAEEIVRLDGGRHFELCPDALRKIRQTADQVGKGRADRLENLRGSMEADAAVVRGRTVILLDDIVTTGATLAEAKRALADAGAARVTCVAVAH